MNRLKNVNNSSIKSSKNTQHFKAVQNYGKNSMIFLGFKLHKQ
jgi:hypothetical protein